MASNRLRSDSAASSRQDEPNTRSDRTQDTLSTREAADTLGISEQAVRQAIARGTLAAARRGRVYRIRRDELRRYAQRRQGIDPDEPRARIVALPAPPAAPTAPIPNSRFVGREAELAALAALVTDPTERVMTLTGPGGIGKTRLALAAAAATQGHFPDGAHFVDLSAVTRPDLVVATIAHIVGLREQTGQSRREQLAAFLRGKRALLILDNFEQLLDAAPDVAWIAARAPGVSVLATSRAPLRLDGERVFPVPPLSVATGGADRATLLTSDAGRLFVERAQGRDPGFAVDDDSAPVIADICARLDGLPLAIELAAARSRVLSPHALRDRLEPRLPLLSRGTRDASPRHSTMRDAIAWSYDLLGPVEQCVFRRLALFSGGFTLEAVEAVLGSTAEAPGDGALAIVDAIDELLDQSLLTTTPGPDGEPRFRMLETIRAFGLEQVEPDEANAVRAAHARYFLHFAQALRPLTDTQATAEPLDLLAADDANLQDALKWWDDQQDSAAVAGMVAACWTYWYAVGRLHEAEVWLDRALNAIEQASGRDRALLLVAYGELLMVKGDPVGAERAFAAAIPHMRAVGDPFDLAMGLMSSGAALNYGGQYAAAEIHFHEAFDLAEAIPDPTLRAAVTGDALNNLSVSARGRGDLDLAGVQCEQALHWFRDQGLELAEIRVLVNLAGIATDQGDHALAVASYQSILDRLGEKGEIRLIAAAFAGIAHAATMWGEHRAALLLIGAAAALRERIGLGMTLPMDGSLRDRDLETLREAVGPREADAIQREGRALSLAEAVALAATVGEPGRSPARHDPGTPALTRREKQVLGQIVEGLTDSEIAEVLFLSPRTVNWHVRSILAKLGVPSRREAIARARVQGLLPS